MTSYPCETCSGGPTRSRWFHGTLGLTAVWACSETCAVAARERHGGARFVVLGPAREVVPKQLQIKGDQPPFTAGRRDT